MKEVIKYKFNSTTIYFLKILISISCSMLTIILSTRFALSDTIMGAMLALCIMLIILVIKKDIFEGEVFLGKLIMATILSFYTMNIFLSFEYNLPIAVLSRLYNIKEGLLEKLLGIFAMPAMIFFVYKFISIIMPKVKDFFIKMSLTEKRYINIVIITAIALSFFTLCLTNLFIKPRAVDLLYTTDSLILINDDVFCNPGHGQNDLRQPLYGIFALPFGIFAHIISEFVFFIPNEYSYGFSMVIIQFIINAISTILIARLMRVDEKDKKYLYSLFSFSFPYLIFSLIVEQYAIALFYLILAIYMFYNKEGFNYAYIGAVGTLVTSGIIFPFLSRCKSIRKYIKDLFKCIFIIVILIVVGGQFSQIILLSRNVEYLKGFAKPMPITNKIYQYLNFVKGIFFSCESRIAGGECYWLQKIDNIDVIGIIIIIVLFISAIINRKEFMAKISAFWVLFSMIVLVAIGWGTTENGLILYSLYFAWGFLCLYYLFFKKICKNRKLFCICIIISVLIMGICNFKEFYNILLFAGKYHSL